MSPRKGTFRKGNPGGPGRPPKMRSEQDVEELFLELQLPVHAPPRKPPDDAPLSDWIDYRYHEATFTIFGYWLKKYAIPKKEIPRLLKLYKKQKVLDPTTTLAAVWRKMIPDVIEG